MEPTQLPPGLTVVFPAQGFYIASIIAGTPQDHVDGLDFLLQGCSQGTTSTTTDDDDHHQHHDDHHDDDDHDQHDHHDTSRVPRVPVQPTLPGRA